MSKKPFVPRWLGCVLLVYAVVSILHWKEGKLAYHSNLFDQRHMLRTENGVVRWLDCSTPLHISNGQVTKFQPGAVVKLRQEGGDHPCGAELREHAGKLELWIKDDRGFHPGSAADDAWLSDFLREVVKYT